MYTCWGVGEAHVDFGKAYLMQALGEHDTKMAAKVVEVGNFCCH